MNTYSSITIFLLFLSCISSSLTVELTFELPDNAKECFYEEIEAGTDFTVEFQVYIRSKYMVVFILDYKN